MTEQRTDDLSTDEGQDRPHAAAAVGSAETPSQVTPGPTEREDSVPGGAADAEAVVAAGGTSETDAENASAEPVSGLTAGTADEDRAVGAGSGGEVGTDEDQVADEGHEAHEDEVADESGVSDEADATGSDRKRRRGGSRRSQLEREGEVAADFLETLLDICDLDGDLDVDVDGDRAAVAIVDSDEGRVPRRLVGQDAHVLEALQELTRLAVQSETGERSRLMLDIAGHRADRRATLVDLAKEAIAEVERSGEPASLAPMTAFERKVVHDEVLAAGLHSESEGSEPRRYVVITRPS